MLTDPLIREIPKNTKVIYVFDLLEQVKNKPKRQYLRGRLQTLLDFLLNGCWKYRNYHERVQLCTLSLVLLLLPLENFAEPYHK